MEIPKKFEVNTEDFKIYFDNDKKTYVCENLDTGEKTNIGVLGIFLQMGIIKPIDEKTDDRVKSILERLNNLDAKINEIARSINGISVKPEEKEVVTEEAYEKPKSEINERIMKNVLEQTEDERVEEEPVKEEVVEEEEEPEEDVTVESDEEIENWMNI